MLKPLIATAVVVSSASLQPLPAAAASTARFYDALSLAGVRVIHQDTCDPHNLGWTAFYHSSDNHLCISHRITRYPRTLLNVLAHESSHAAQDCKAGRDNGRYASLGVSTRGLTAQERSWVSTESASERIYEAEAYSLAHEPARALQLLKKYCGQIPYQH